MPPRRIAIVGLGGIAQKAYLPVIASREDVEPLFCTRDEAVLERLSRAYRVRFSVTNVPDVLALEPDAAMVHVATVAHEEIVSAFLTQGIHVYVDKPIAYEFDACRRLAELAEANQCVLAVGFNRRFAPMYQRLLEIPSRRIILIQKNRVGLPDAVRRVIFDDFIHVVDTMRYLLPSEPEEVRVTGRVEEGVLHHVMLELVADGSVAVGLMNRMSGVTEEVVEVMSHGVKVRVEDLNRMSLHRDGTTTTKSFPDWDPILKRRGFPQIVEDFLTTIRAGRTASAALHDALRTHELCEAVVRELERSHHSP